MKVFRLRGHLTRQIMFPVRDDPVLLNNGFYDDQKCFQTVPYYRSEDSYNDLVLAATHLIKLRPSFHLSHTYSLQLEFSHFKVCHTDKESIKVNAEGIFPTREFEIIDHHRCENSPHDESIWKHSFGWTKCQNSLFGVLLFPNLQYQVFSYKKSIFSLILRSQVRQPADSFGSSFRIISRDSDRQVFVASYAGNYSVSAVTQNLYQLKLTYN